MKIRLLFITCFVFLLAGLYAQTSITTIPVELKWKGIERWYADSLYVDVVTFEGAMHDGDDRLPFFHYSTSIDEAYSYKVELKNPLYVEAVSEDITFLRSALLLEQPEIETYISSAREEKTLHVSFFPFIQREERILKLKSFDLVIEKSAKANRAAQAATIHTYADESILSKGRFVKVQIKESGVYKLTYDELINKGIDPENVRMFGYGGAMLDEDFSKSKYDDLPEIAVYDTGNAILFYAQGINKWTYNKSAEMFTHELNVYSNYGYYFVTSDNIGEKKRIQLKNEIDPGSVTPVDITEFTDYKVHEKELVNLIKAGREFYGEKLAVGTTIDVPFEFSNLKLSSTMKVNLSVIGISTRTLNSDGSEKINNKSTFSLKLNGGQTQRLIVDGKVSAKYESAIAGTSVYDFTVNNTNIIFNLNFANSAEAVATGYLNYVEVNAQRDLKMEGSVMPFHNKLNVATNAFNRYFVETTNPDIQIWDVNDILNVQQIPATNESGNIVFTDSSANAKSYIALDVTAISDIPSATLLSEVPTQNIHAMEPLDMLIITHPLFVKPAEDLARAHGEITGLKVGIVTTEQVYNEFSSGTPDASAYRWVTKMFYDRPQNKVDKIKYLLLLGKGCYDNRSLFPETGDKFVLTYQAINSISQTRSYVTDDYYGLLDDTEGLKIGSSDRIDIGIGRIPVKTEDDAAKIVEKTIKYMKNENKGAWKNQLCFIGDNGDSRSHMEQANSLADRVAKAQPAYYINKILLDAYQQDKLASDKGYPGAKKHFQDLLASGLLYVNYMGHGTMNGWSTMLHRVGIKELQNENLPLFASGTCEFSRFDKESVTAAEELLKNASGGAIGVFSATRTVYSNYNNDLMKEFSDSLFILGNRKANSNIGDAVMKAKNRSFGGDKGINTLSFIYFGDPAVRLNYPTQYNVLTTEINGNQVTGKDTLNALSVTTINGIIANENGEKIDDFNGKLQLILLDKEQKITTLKNVDNIAFEYKDRPNVVYKGKATVKNGEFEITFMLPKDVKYHYGTGRLNFYAWDDENDYEAQGYCEKFIIGGFNDDFVEENVGPELAIYLNDRNFVSGGKVNETPLFLADLSDLSGINTSSVTPGHDLMLCIDNETWLELNDYYESKQGDYQRGNINYQLPEMTEGKHILMFRAWDLLANSTVKTLEFEVVKDLETQLFAIHCYPNPVVNEAKIQITHDRRNEIVNVTLDIFDISGKKVWTKTQNSLEAISWDLTKENGEKVSAGMYIYRVNVETNDKVISTKSDKIIVTKQ